MIVLNISTIILGLQNVSLFSTELKRQDQQLIDFKKKLMMWDLCIKYSPH